MTPSSASPSATPSGRPRSRSSTPPSGAGHPVDPPQRAVARAARPRPPPEARPGDGHVRDAPHRRPRSRPTRRRRARILAALGLPVPRQELVYSADGAVEAAESHRLPGRHQAAQRQPRARHLDPPHADADAGARRLRHRAAARDQPRRARRELRDGLRPPDARRRRRARSRRQARAGARHGRRRATPSRRSSPRSTADPRRGVGHEKVLTQITVRRRRPSACIDRRRATRDRDRAPGRRDVLPPQHGQPLRPGGTAIDLTDVVHPDNREMAVRAVRAVGLDVGGVDFL